MSAAPDCRLGGQNFKTE